MPDNMQLMVEIGGKIDASFKKGVEELKKSLEGLGSVSGVESSMNRIAAALLNLGNKIDSLQTKAVATGSALNRAFSGPADNITLYERSLARVQGVFTEFGNKGAGAFQMVQQIADGNTQSLGKLSSMFKQVAKFGTDSKIFSHFEDSLARSIMTGKGLQSVITDFERLKKLQKEGNVSPNYEGGKFGTTNKELSDKAREAERLRNAEKLKHIKEEQERQTIAGKKVLDDLSAQEAKEKKIAAEREKNQMALLNAALSGKTNTFNDSLRKEYAALLKKGDTGATDSQKKADKEKAANDAAELARMKEKDKRYQQLQASIKKYNKEVEAQAKASDFLSNSMAQLGRSFGTIVSYSVVGAVLYGVTNALKSAATAVIDFDQSLKNIQAITGATNGEMLYLSSSLLKIAVNPQVKFSLQELSEGLTILGQAGYTATESIGLLEDVAKFSTATLSNMKTSVELVTTVLKSFEIDARDASHVVDILANAVNRSKLTTEGLNTAFNYIGPVAKDAGLSLADTSAALGIMANAGLRASTSGTALRNVLDRLISPTDDVRKKLVALGANVEVLSPVGKDFADVLSDLEKVVKTTGQAFDIFGLRAAPAVMSLLNLGSDGFRRMRAEMDQFNTSSTMAGIAVQGMNAMMQKINTNLEVFAVRLGEESGLTNAYRSLLAFLVKGTELLSEFGTKIVYVSALLSGPFGQMGVLFSKMANYVFGWSTATDELVSSQRRAVAEMEKEAAVANQRISNMKSLLVILKSYTATEESRQLALAKVRFAMDEVGYSTDALTTSTQGLTVATEAGFVEMQKFVQELELRAAGQQRLVDETEAQNVDALRKKLVDLRTELEKINRSEASPLEKSQASEKILKDMGTANKAIQELSDKYYSSAKKIGDTVSSDFAALKLELLTTVNGTNKEMLDSLLQGQTAVTKQFFEYIARTKHGFGSNSYKEAMDAWNTYEANRIVVSGKTEVEISNERRKALNQYTKDLELAKKEEEAVANFSLNAWKSASGKTLAIQQGMYDTMKREQESYIAQVTADLSANPQKWQANKDGIMKTVTDMYNNMKKVAGETHTEIMRYADRMAQEYKNALNELATLEQRSSSDALKWSDRERERQKIGKSTGTQDSMTKEAMLKDQASAEEGLKKIRLLRDEQQKLAQVENVTPEQKQRLLEINQSLETEGKRVQELIDHYTRLNDQISQKYEDGRKNTGNTEFQKNADIKAQELQQALAEQTARDAKRRKAEAEEGTLTANRNLAALADKMKELENSFSPEKVKGTFIDAMTTAMSKMAQAASDAQAKLSSIPTDKDTKYTFSGTEEAETNINKLKALLDSLPEEKKTRVQVEGGGLSGAAIGMWGGLVTARDGIMKLMEGGAIPGFGGGDVVPARLEAGEVVVNKYSAREYMPLLMGINNAKGRMSDNMTSAVLGAQQGKTSDGKVMLVRIQDDSGVEQAMTVNGEGNIDVYTQMLESLKSKRLTVSTRN